MELTGIDVHHLSNELAALKGAKIQKVYQTEEYELILDLYSKAFPYRYLYFKMPNLVFAKNAKPEMPEKPLGFAHRMRPHLNNAFIHNDYQKGTDRIIVFMVERKQKYYLIVELFGKGNIILCNENMKIINILLSESFSSRTLKPGREYEFPPTRDASFESIESFRTIIEKEKSKHAISTIAGLGFGGKYSDIIMKRAVGDGYYEKTWEQLDNSQIERIHQLMLSYWNARFYTEKAGDIFIETNDFEHGFSSFFACLDSMINIEEESKEKKETSDKQGKKKEKAIELQRKRQKELEEKSDSDNSKGKAIYSNYEPVENALAFARGYKEKNGSLKGLEEEWPGKLPKLKKVEAKGNSITLEIE